jgi:signal transduction histidine kinase
VISTSGTAGEKGTGLGLRLCHELALANNGDLVIKSEEGVGTTVRIMLPVKPG